MSHDPSDRPSAGWLADETPRLDSSVKGSAFEPTSPRATEPVVGPERTVDGCAKAFLDELNF